MALTVAASFYKTLTQLNGKFINAALLAINGMASAGTGLTVNITAASGVPATIAINVAGTGYATGQLFSITQSSAAGGIGIVTAQSSGIPSAVALFAGSQPTPVGYSTANALATVSAISVPHGLPEMPIEFAVNPGPGGGWGVIAPPDATNFYIVLAGSGATYGWITAFYGRP